MSAEPANARINHLWERLALGLLTLLLGWSQVTYQEDRQEFKELEAKVQTLYLEKVSKSDLRDVEDRLNLSIAGLKSDILSRLDLYFGKLDARKQQQ